MRSRLVAGAEPAALADEVTRRAGDLVTVRRWATQDHERAIGTFWRTAFDRFEVLISVATGFVDEWHLSADAEARARAGDPRYDAVPRLVRRGLQMAHEILELLTSGYPAAGMARWRSAHEITIVALALANEPQELAQRYLDHQWIEEERTLATMPHAMRLGDDDLAAYEQSVRGEATRARAAHPVPAFARPSGWMATLVPSRQFAELERRFGTESARMWYRHGNAQTHAGHIGPATQLGNDVGSEESQLIGPGYADLEQVGVVAPHTVRALVVALLRLQPVPQAHEFDATVEAIRYAAAVAFGETAGAVCAMRDRLSEAPEATP